MSQEDKAAQGRPEYPIGVPSKFDPDGNIQDFPGNTILAHLSPSSPLYASMLSLYKKLQESPLSHLYALLPPPSWHMTVFEGVCDQVRKPGFWPADLPADAPLGDCTALFTQKLAAFDVGDDGPPYLMKVVGFSTLEVGIGVHVEPRTAEEGRRLQRLRDRLAGTLKIRHPQHDTYELHLSVAYLLRHLDGAQEGALMTLLLEHFREMPLEFELGAPEFCTFDDMAAFKRVLYLGGLEEVKG
ncbi:DUF1868-domain-containing protein [Pleurostoma richardsiae]|uniref:DUF1868-domain-containing protein n=1 Tax=Pleurostoma richardsiae TaxID=41990 RepID=A0AA38RBV8_9PEZI|nr:DUF1868-domain-containing protein [Pleurostoma richardsiae]